MALLLGVVLAAAVPGVVRAMKSEAQQYRETLAIERAIESDPVAKEQWINRQLTLDAVEWAEDGELVGAGEE